MQRYTEEMKTTFERKTQQTQHICSAHIPTKSPAANPMLYTKLVYLRYGAQTKWREQMEKPSVFVCVLHLFIATCLFSHTEDDPAYLLISHPWAPQVPALQP